MWHHRLTALVLLLSFVLYFQPVLSRPAAGVAELNARAPGLSKKPSTNSPVTSSSSSKKPAVPAAPPSKGNPSSSTDKTKPPAKSPTKSDPPAKSPAKQPASSSSSCPLKSTKQSRGLVKRADVCGISSRLQSLARDGCDANAESITFDRTGNIDPKAGHVDGTQCDHILELQIAKAALQGTICNALNNMVQTAASLDVATNGLSVVKQGVLETLFTKLNADARNLYYLASAENQAKGRFVGDILAGRAPASDQVSKNIGSYIRYVDGTRGKQPVTEFAASLDQVVDNILTETANEAKAAINAKLEKGGTERTVTACSAELAKIDQDLSDAKGKNAISAEWKRVKDAAVTRGS